MKVNSKLLMPTDSGIDLATDLLITGNIIGMPTETVYGLAGDATNPIAISNIYLSKGRPSKHPVIVHLSPKTDPGAWISKLPNAARQLIDNFWPGPLTVVLPCAKHVSKMITGGQETVGLRCPSHPVTQKLLTEFSRRKKHGQSGIVAPSANMFGSISPTTAQHVIHEFDKKIYVLDGGLCEIGIESTIVNVSLSNKVTLLRPGFINIKQIAEILGYAPKLITKNVSLSTSTEIIPNTPGTLKIHYAPKTPLFFMSSTKILESIYKSSNINNLSSLPIVVISQSETKKKLSNISEITSILAFNEPIMYAKNLYSMLRYLDSLKYSKIYVETLPVTWKWQAINDRLRRASSIVYKYVI